MMVKIAFLAHRRMRSVLQKQVCRLFVCMVVKSHFSCEHIHALHSVLPSPHHDVNFRELQVHTVDSSAETLFSEPQCWDQLPHLASKLATGISRGGKWASQKHRQGQLEVL